MLSFTMFIRSKASSCTTQLLSQKHHASFVNVGEKLGILQHFLDSHGHFILFTTKVMRLKVDWLTALFEMYN